MNNTKPGSVGGVGKPRDQPVAQKRFTYVSRGKRRQGDGELSLVRELYGNVLEKEDEVFGGNTR